MRLRLRERKAWRATLPATKVAPMDDEVRHQHSYIMRKKRTYLVCVRYRAGRMGASSHCTERTNSADPQARGAGRSEAFALPCNLVA